MALARKGFSVVCADRNASALQELAGFTGGQAQALPIVPVCADLVPGRWPFARGCFSAIVCVHFVETIALLPWFHYSLSDGGHLYVETIGGQGENYRDLPETSALRRLLAPGYEFAWYKERRVGPPGARKVAVKLLAKKL